MDHLLDYIDLGKLFKCAGLLDVCVSFMRQNFKELMDTPHFKELSPDILNATLRAIAVGVKNEHRKLKAIVSWTDSTPRRNHAELKKTSRYEHFPDLFATLNIHLLSKEALMEVIEGESDIAAVPAYR